jgi:hypothetical protein
MLSANDRVNRKGFFLAWVRLVAILFSLLLNERKGHAFRAATQGEITKDLGGAGARFARVSQKE